MGYGMHFPAHQVGGQAELSMGYNRLWVITGSAVLLSRGSRDLKNGTESIKFLKHFNGTPHLTFLFWIY